MRMMCVHTQLYLITFNRIDTIISSVRSTVFIKIHEKSIIVN